jgi:hypothetical protein
VGEADRADDRGDAQRFEEVLVVGAHRAVRPEPHSHAAVEQLAHWRDAAAEPEIAPRVMGDGGAGIGEHADVIVAEPDPVGADEVRPEHPVLGEARDDRSAMAAPALDHLDLGLGEVRVDANPVLAREPDEAVEQLVGGLIRDGRRRGDAHAALGGAVPALDQPRGEVEQALRGGRRDVLDGPSQVRR